MLHAGIAGPRKDSEGGEGEKGEGRRGATLLAFWAPDPALPPRHQPYPSLHHVSVLSVVFADTTTAHHPNVLWETRPPLLDKTQSHSCKEGSGLLRGLRKAVALTPGKGQGEVLQGWG